MVKYIIKYSNIEYSTDDMEVLEFISQFLSIYYRFIAEAEKTGEQIRRSLPFIVRHFASKKRIVYTVCNIKYELSGIKAPYIRFLYVSPAGRSSYDNKIVLDCGLVKQVVNELSKTLSKKGHSKYQRSIMTNDLREAIKKRDNYTCCKCGNSVYKEPNLLLEVDHIIPVSKGGKTEASNLQTLCWR